jgi:hypothetical protein
MKIADIVMGDEYVSTDWRIGEGAHFRAVRIEPAPKGAQRQVAVIFVEEYEKRYSRGVWRAGEEVLVYPRDLEPWGPYGERRDRERKLKGEVDVILDRLRKEASLGGHGDGRTSIVAVSMRYGEWAQWLNSHRVQEISDTADGLPRGWPHA